MTKRFHKAALVGLLSLWMAFLSEPVAGADGGWTEPAPERPLLKRPVLKEAVVADYAAGLEAAGTKAESGEVTATVDGGRLVGVWAARSKDQTLTLYRGAGLEVGGYDHLRFDIENRTAERVQTTLRFGDDKPYELTLPLDPGVNRLCLPLTKVMGDKPLSARPLEKLTQIQMSVRRQGSDAKLAVGRIAVQKLFSDRAAIRFFDFGGGDYCLGAIPVAAGAVTGDQKLPYTVTGENFVGRNWHGEFPLFGDGVEAKDLKVALVTGEGAFEAQTVAFGTDWQGVRNRSYTITANGQTVVDVAVTKDNFFSFEYAYYGANLFYDSSRSLFDQYHRTYFAPARFAATAQDGQVTLGYDNAAVYALWVYPQAQAEEGRAFVACCYAEQAYALWLNHARMRAHAANTDGAPVEAENRARGYTVFTRHYQDRVYPNYAPTAGDLVTPAGLAAAAAPGEFEPVTFTVRPEKDLGKTQVVWSELVSGENKIAATQWRSHLIKCAPYQVTGIWYEAIPTMLYPYADRELKTGENQQYWATLNVPAGTPAGEYTGTVSIIPAAGMPTAVPIKVTVYPFDLPRTTTECGMWNNSVYGSHMVNSFPDNDARIDALLDAECRNMVEHGLNGYDFGGIRATNYDTANCTVTLDWSHYNRILAACRANGMSGRHMLQVMNFAQYGLMRRGFPTEFTSEFNKAYLNGLTQLRDWIADNRVPAVVQITDEPRETELNPWNRNLRDTIKYLQLARQISGLKTMVTVMGDKGSFGRPYAPIVSLVDVLATHSWPRSDDIIFLSTETGLADFWAYNNGFNRFVHGFYLWKSKATGHWQWVYSWEVCDAHVPVFFTHDTSAVYAFPGGFLNTIKYEDIREGIDDHRYLEVLLTTLKGADNANPAKAPAQEFLKVLDKFLPQYPHDTGLSTGAEAGGVYSESKQNLYFPVWRAQIAEYIAALNAKREPAKQPAAWAMFPQSATEEARAVVCVLIDKAAAPAIDGAGDDKVWADAKEVDDFVDLAQGRLASIQTKVKTLCDGEKMYFLFTCGEPKYGELKGYAINRDEDTWEDDSVEIFLDTAFDRTTYKHISVNCLGTVQDTDGRDVLWNGTVQAAVRKSKGAWTVEIAVALDNLGGKAPAEGVQWGVNLCRNRQPAPQQTSSWAFVGHSFHNPGKFGTLVFKK